jgi:hypothetical protein
VHFVRDVAASPDTQGDAQLWGHNNEAKRTLRDLALARDDQLQLQFQGFGAFDDPSIQQRLQLTDQQRVRLERLQQDWKQRMSNLGANFASNRNSRASFNELRREAGDRISEILTDEQRRKWSEMLGDPYDFPPTAYFTFDDSNNPATTPGANRARRP